MIPAQGSCQWFGFSSLITCFLMLRLHWVSNMQLIRSGTLAAGVGNSSLLDCIFTSQHQSANDKGQRWYHPLMFPNGYAAAYSEYQA